MTQDLRIHGYKFPAAEAEKNPMGVYGADAEGIEGLVAHEPELGKKLDEALPYTGAQVVWAAREEMARTLDDVLARRTRALLLNAGAAGRMAPAAARLLARELGKDAAWEQEQVRAFRALAAQYSVNGNA